MILLLDIGNTNTHVGLANGRRVITHQNVPTNELLVGKAGKAITRLLRNRKVTGAALSSVVPRATRPALTFIRERWSVDPVVLTAQTVTRIGVNYPRPESIGPDRLANAAAVRVLYGAPAVVVDFGTAVTFDVVDRRGDYIGGIIAPGLAAMTGYLHEKTALLPRIEIRETKATVGRSTEEAMLIGAVHGYRGLVRELIQRLQKKLKTRSLPVIATGGYAALIAKGLPEITAVEPLLTLEGLRIVQSDHCRHQ